MACADLIGESLTGKGIHSAQGWTATRFTISPVAGYTNITRRVFLFASSCHRPEPLSWVSALGRESELEEANKRSNDK